MDEVEQIRQKIDIVSLISEYLPLKKMGRNFKMLCPFHTEKTPSFVVSPERQIWHCFGCSIGGDIFTFIMKYENIEFPEALRMLAKRAGITLSGRNLLAEGRGKKKERLYEANHLSSEFYHYILMQHKKGTVAREYLSKRGITPQVINLFKLGFSPPLPNGLTRYLTEKKGFTPAELEEAGLTVRIQNSEFRIQNYIDRFRNRIMFPLLDHRGNIVGFSGRVLTDSENVAKYINTPETLVYHKGEHLFGLNLAKDAIKKKGSAILVEGEFDVIQGFIHSIENIVAIKGTALTDGQASLLKRFTEKVTICLDQDSAGIDATFRSVGVLEDKGMLVNVIVLPQGKDPDECLRLDPKRFIEAVKREVPVYDFLLGTLLTRFNPKTPEGKKRVAEELLPFFSRIQNEIIKDHYVKKLAGELSVSPESILREMEKRKKAREIGVTEPEELVGTTKKRGRREMLEEYLVSLLIQSDEIKDSFQETRNILDALEIESPIYQKIFVLLEGFLKDLASRGKREFSIKKFIKKAPEELHFAIDTCYLLSLPSFSRGVESRSVGDDKSRFILEIDKTATEIKALSIKSQMQNLSSKIKEEEEKKNEESLTKLKEEFNVLMETLRVLTISTLPASSASL